MDGAAPQESGAQELALQAVAPLATFRDVIDLWPKGTFAADMGVKPATVRQWRSRDTIPAELWAKVWLRAQARGLPVTAERLLLIAGAEALGWK